MGDYTPGPLTIVEDTKWPFMIRIMDANGVEVHSEDRIAHTTKWKSLDDVYRAIGWPWNERDNVIAMIESQMADIRLRAAAPDLLEALEGAIGALEQDLDAGRDSGDADWEGLAYERLEAAKFAIAKAKGANQ